MSLLLLLTRKKDVENIEQFAKEFFAAIDAPYHERDSVNFTNGYYFMGRLKDLKIRVYFSENREYPYGIWIDYDEVNLQELELLLRNKVKTAGFELIDEDTMSQPSWFLTH